jgi:hypothetical protein
MDALYVEMIGWDTPLKMTLLPTSATASTPPFRTHDASDGLHGFRPSRSADLRIQSTSEDLVRQPILFRAIESG